MTPNLSLRKKSAARLLAVQALYQQAVQAGTEGEQLSADALIAQMLQQVADEKLLKEPEFSLPEKPDIKIFRGIVSGVCADELSIDAWVAVRLRDKWTEKRLTPLLLAIFRAAAWELRYTPNLRPAILINEYTDVTSRFYDNGEVAMVNGLLQELVKENAKLAATE